jgi:hypothetical protein
MRRAPMRTGSRDAAHQAALRHQSLLTQSETIRDALARSREQVTRSTARLRAAGAAREENDNPPGGLEELSRGSSPSVSPRRGADHGAPGACGYRAHAPRGGAGAGADRGSARGNCASSSKPGALQSRACKHQQDTLAGAVGGTGGDLETLLEALPEDVDTGRLAELSWSATATALPGSGRSTWRPSTSTAAVRAQAVPGRAERGPRVGAGDAGGGDPQDRSRDPQPLQGDLRPGQQRAAGAVPARVRRRLGLVSR